MLIASYPLLSAVSSLLADLEVFEHHAELVFSILTKVSIIIIVLFAIAYVVRILADKSYSIRRINVPASFEPAGHSGPVIANRIYYRIQQIIQRVSATEFSSKYSTTATDADVSVEVAGMGLPIKGFIEMLGSTLGIQRSKKVDADIFLEKNSVIMMLRITGHNAERFEAPTNDDFDVPLRVLVLQAAETILKYSNDEVLQTYFGIIEQIGDKQIRLARYRLEKYKNNPTVEVNVVAALAWGLCMLKRYGEAEEEIKEGIPRFKKPGRIYMIWGTMLQQQGKHEEAIEKLQLAILHATPKESKYRRANTLAAMGRSFAKMGKREAAIEYFEKAIQMDDNSSGAYFNLAKVKLRSDQGKGLEFFEKALARGLRVQVLINDPDCESMLKDPLINKLVERYREE